MVSSPRRRHAGLSVVLVSVLGSLGASARTANFVVEAPSADLARRVAAAAEVSRRDLAIRWLGHPMPCWASPCRIRMRPDRLAAGGATTFSFQRGEAFGWQMLLQGPEQQVLDSILPHEITHTILACRFRRPLPRWADEGAATLAESTGERRRQQAMIRQLLETGRQLPLSQLLAIGEYPTARSGVTRLYAQGASLVAYLVHLGGHARFLKFLDTAEESGWTLAATRHYGKTSLSVLERDWALWVRSGAGSPLAGSPTRRVVLGWRATHRRRPKIVVRGQSPGPPGRSGSWRAPDPRNFRLSRVAD